MSVEVTQWEEKRFVGFPVTCSFANTSEVGEANRYFMEHRTDIENQVNTDEYTCLHFANEVVFTYIYCMEVSDFGKVPAGMIRLTVPGHPYAKVRAAGEEPYGIIEAYAREHGLEMDKNAFAIEVFRIGGVESKFNADILVPLKGRS